MMDALNATRRPTFVISPWAAATSAEATSVDLYVPTATYSEAPPSGSVGMQTAACVIGLAAIAIPGMSSAQAAEAAPPPPSSISRIHRPNDAASESKEEKDSPTSAGQAKAKAEAAPRAGDPQGVPQAADPTTPEQAPDVPWYDPVERRARDFNDGLKGIRNGVDEYAGKLNHALNDNALSRYEASGQLGDYTWRFDPLSSKIDPNLTLRLNRWGASVRAETSIVRGSLSKQEKLGDWTRTQGLRGEVNARWELGRDASLKLNGIHVSDLDYKFAGPRLEAFQQWSRLESGPWKLVADFNVGVQHDFLTGTPITYGRALQRIDNDQITRRWLGDGSYFRAELEEGVQHDLHTGNTAPYYRTMAAVGKPYQFKLFTSKPHTVDVEAGLQAQGTKDQPFEVKPVVRARVHW